MYTKFQKSKPTKQRQKMKKEAMKSIPTHRHLYSYDLRRVKLTVLLLDWLTKLFHALVND